MREYDVIVIGAGVAGASSAYFLKNAGLSVLVLEQDSICSGDSSAAGAFLSPKISKPSPYKEYLNRAFLFSTKFYKDNFSKYFIECGLKKIPYDHDDILRCRSYEPYIELNYKKDKDSYFFPDAGLIRPKQTCLALLKDIEVIENYKVEKIVQQDGWIVGDYKSKHLILATSSSSLPFDLPYIKTKNIAGYRYDVKFDLDSKIKHNIFKKVSISAYHDSVVAIGATHIRPNELVNLQHHAENDSFDLIKKAKELHDMKNLKIIKNYIGYRNSTFDFFPIVGRVIDEKATLDEYPSIKKGTKIPTHKYHYHQNLYIHTALGSRGFVYAPYNSLLLKDLIVENREIDHRLSPVRLFKKYAVNNNMIY